MTRWQRFKHAFEACRGPLESEQYIPPSGAKIKGVGFEIDQLIEEALYGVTLCRHRCSKCGKRFTNRELGDARVGSDS